MYLQPFFGTLQSIKGAYTREGYMTKDFEMVIMGKGEGGRMIDRGVPQK